MSVKTWVVVKIMVPSWVPIIIRHLVYLGYPKRDYNFDNYPHPFKEPGSAEESQGLLVGVDPSKGVRAGRAAQCFVTCIAS